MKNKDESSVLLTAILRPKRSRMAGREDVQIETTCESVRLYYRFACWKRRFILVSCLWIVAKLFFFIAKFVGFIWP